MSGPIPSGFNLFISDITTAFGAVYLTDTLDAEWKSVCTEVPIKGAQFVSGWTGVMPKARVWSGARVVHRPAAQTYTAIPIKYEITYAIGVDEVADDLYGIYFRMLPDMVRQTRRWQALETRDLLENAGAYTGAKQNGYDGLTFFNTAHLIDIYNSTLGTYSNDFSGGGANVTYTKANGGTVNVLTGGAFGFTALKTLYEYMMTIKGEDGERLGIRPETLMHPVNLKGEVELVLKSMFAAPPAWGTITGQVGTANNPLKQYGITPYQNDYLNDPQMWYLGDTSRAYKPLFFGMREAWKIVPRTAPTDSNVFDNNELLIGGDARGMPFWGYSWMLTRSGP